MTVKDIRTSDILILAAAFLLTAASALLAPGIRIDSSTEVFIPQDHEIKQINGLIEQEFSSLSPIIMGIESRFGTIYDQQIIRIIDDITGELERMPESSRVISLTNLDYIIGSEYGLEVVPVMQGTDSEGIGELRSRITDWKDVYEGTVISADERFAAVIVQPQSGSSEEEDLEIYRRMEELAETYASPAVSFAIAGLPVIKNEINRSVLSDIFYLVPIAAVIILAVLLVSFRRLEGVIFPMITLLASMTWILGIISLLDITFTMATLLVPVLLLVVGSAYSIHILSHFYHEVSQRRGFLDARTIREIIDENQRRIRLPILLAGATTAGGFISLVSSPLGPFRAFGLLSALGIGFSLLSALLGIPALLRIRYRKGIDTERFHRTDEHGRRISPITVFSRFERIVTRRRWSIALISVALFGTALLLIPRVTVGTDMVQFFHPSSRLALSVRALENRGIGSNTVAVMIESPEPGGVLDPVFLSDIEKFTAYIEEASPAVKNSQSLVPHIKRINQLMHADVPGPATAAVVRRVVPAAGEADEEQEFGFGSIFSDEPPEEELLPEISSTVSEELAEPAPSVEGYEYGRIIREGYLEAGLGASVDDVIFSVLRRENTEGLHYYEIPLDPQKYGMQSTDELKNLITQYLIMYSGSLTDLINDSLEPDKTLITLQVGNDTYAGQKELQSLISAFWEHHLPEGWSFQVGGGATLAYVLSSLVTRSQYISLAAALIIVWLLVSLIFRSLRAGLLAMIPVFFALAGIFICMVVFNFQLDIVTSLLASLAIGIGVDYGIHFLEAYRTHLHRGTRRIVMRVYQTTGSAIYINALSVALGFTGLVISRFTPIRQLGILFAVAMLLSGLASLIVLPAVLERINGKRLGAVPAPEGEK